MTDEHTHEHVNDEQAAAKPRRRKPPTTCEKCSQQLPRKKRVQTGTPSEKQVANRERFKAKAAEAKQMCAAEPGLRFRDAMK